MKIKKFLAMTLMAAASTAMVACSNDDDGKDDTPQNYEGTYEVNIKAEIVGAPEGTPPLFDSDTTLTLAAFKFTPGDTSKYANYNFVGGMYSASAVVNTAEVGVVTIPNYVLAAVKELGDGQEGYFVLSVPNYAKINIQGNDITFGILDEDDEKNSFLYTDKGTHKIKVTLKGLMYLTEANLSLIKVTIATK